MPLSATRTTPMPGSTAPGPTTTWGRRTRPSPDYSQVINLRPDDTEAFNNRGLAYDAVGEYENALRDYGAALDLKPGFARNAEQPWAAYEALMMVSVPWKTTCWPWTERPGFAAPFTTLPGCTPSWENVEQCVSHLGQAIELNPRWAMRRPGTMSWRGCWNCDGSGMTGVATRDFAKAGCFSRGWRAYVGAVVPNLLRHPGSGPVPRSWWLRRCGGESGCCGTSPGPPGPPSLVPDPSGIRRSIG